VSQPESFQEAFVRKNDRAWHRLSLKTLVFALPLLTAVEFQAGAPALINYQGRLADSANNPLTGSYSFRFDIFSVQTGGGSEWDETKSLNVQNGIFEVQLGSSTAFPATLFDGTSKWLQVTVDGDPLSPRERLLAVPYALRVANDSIVNADIKSTAEINPAKITGGIFQDEIYTFSSLSQLRVDGWLNQSSSFGGLKLFGAPSDVDSARLEIYGKNAGDPNKGNIVFVATNENATPSAGGRFVFLTYQKGPPEVYFPRLTIDRDGLMGVATDNPADQLDLGAGALKIVNATTTAGIASPGLIARSSTESGARFAFPNPGGAGSVYLNNSGLGWMNVNATKDIAYFSGKAGLRLFTNETQRLQITESGSVIVSSNTLSVDGSGGSLKVGGQGTPVTSYLSATQLLSFPSIAKNTTAELTITVTGAAIFCSRSISGPPDATINFFSGILVNASTMSATRFTS
jgi:hypothetical protein